MPKCSIRHLNIYLHEIREAIFKKNICGELRIKCLRVVRVCLQRNKMISKEANSFFCR